MGAAVVAADINADQLKTLTEEFSDRSSIYTFQADVSDRSQAEAMIDFAIEKCGKMDIIFILAGINNCKISSSVQ